MAFIDGHEFNGTTESMVVDRLREYRINNGTYRDDDSLRAELWRYWCGREPGRCNEPANSAAGYVSEASVSSDGTAPASWATSQGAKMWRELHFHAAAVYKSGTIDPMALRRWLEMFNRAIGCQECRDNWNFEVAQLPPALSSGQAFFEWTVAIHNAVNARIGKPQFLLADAYRDYQAL